MEAWNHRDLSTEADFYIAGQRLNYEMFQWRKRKMSQLLQCYISPSIAVLRLWAILHKPTRSLTPQLSVSQAETLNKHRIMAIPLGIQNRVWRKKKTQKRKKKVCERVRQEMTDSVWQNKYMSHLATVSHFPSLMLCQFCYSVPEGTFWIGSFNKCSSYLKLQVR